MDKYSFCVYTSDFKCKVEEIIKEEGYSNITVVDNKDALMRLDHINFLFVCKDKNKKIPKYIRRFKAIKLRSLMTPSKSSRQKRHKI